MKNFFWALNFLTIIPTGKKCHESAPEIARVAFWFPIVGLLIGVVLTFAYFPATHFFPHFVSDALILIIYIIITGGLHLDGFADSCDGLFGGNTRERKLEIMRDSQAGSFGVLCLICTLGLKYICITSIDPKAIAGLSLIINQNTVNDLSPMYLNACEKGKVLFIMCAVGRWSQIIAAAVSTYARKGAGTGQLIIEGVNIKHLIFSTFVPGILIFLLCGFKGILILLIALIVTLLMVLYIKRKIGGMTGDTLGAVNEISELAVLLTFVAICFQ